MIFFGTLTLLLEIYSQHIFKLRLEGVFYSRVTFNILLRAMVLKKEINVAICGNKNMKLNHKKGWFIFLTIYNENLKEFMPCIVNNVLL